jgi:CO/xanthine dehydrogenase FAD-binding subunit
MSLQIVRPDSVRAAAEMLGSDPRARFLGGGTLAVRDYSSGDVSIGKFVLCDGLGLDTIRIDAGRVELGAAVTMAMVARHAGLSFLHAVATDIGGPAVRAMATVGGNLFAPAPYGDFAVALLALGATAAVEARSGSEEIDLEAFLRDRGKQAGRVVKSVSFALPPDGAFRFLKVTRRHPHGASVLSIAALLPVDGGKVKGARVAYGAMAPTPIRARPVEAALEGKALNDAAVEAAVAVAGQGVAPASDPFASDWYRASVLPVHLTRLLKR